MGKISAIVVTYQAESYLKPCLLSLQRSSIPLDVAVVDNASTDGSLDLVREFPEFTVMETGGNLGFARGTNAGLGWALEKGADYVLILDQDARLRRDTVEKLVSIAEQNGDLGVISPVHLAGDEHELDPHFRRYLLQACPAALDGCLTAAPVPELVEVPMVNSAIWLLTRKCLGTVGGFDPIYFQYSADKDYCNRVRHHGLKISIAMNALAVHAQIKTLSAEEEEKLIFESPRRQFSFEVTEIKKPNVSFRREFVLAVLRLMDESVRCLSSGHVGPARVKMGVLAKLLRNRNKIHDHWVQCRTKGPHWIAGSRKF